MKRLLVVLLSVSVGTANAGPLLVSAQKAVESAPIGEFVSSCEQAKQDALLDAEEVGGFGVGLAWGVGLGLIGTGIAVATAKAPDLPSVRITGKDQTYTNCYAPVFKEKAKSKKRRERLSVGCSGPRSGWRSFWPPVPTTRFTTTTRPKRGG